MYLTRTIFADGPATVGFILDITDRKLAERTIRESEKKYRTLHESMMDGFVSVSMDGKVLESNEIYRNMLGYSQAELAQLTYIEITPEKWQTIEEDIVENQILKRGYSDIYAKEYRRKDGTVFPVELQTVLMRDEQGKPANMWAIVRDITARKQAEDRLVKLNQCLLNFGADPLENINRLTALGGELLEADCALYNRLDHGMLCSWGQWQTPPGYNPQDHPEGHICYDVIKQGSEQPFIVRNLPETSYARSDPNVASFHLQTYVGQAVKFENQFVGSLCMVYQRDFVPSQDQQRLIGIIASAIAVEENRRRAEDALRESEERYRTVANYTYDWEYWIGPDGQWLYCSPSCERITGYPPEKFIENPVFLAEIAHPEDRDKLNQHLMGRKENEADRFDFRIVRPDGEVYWLAHVCREIVTPDGKNLGRRASNRDITARKQSEAALSQSEERFRSIFENAAIGIYRLAPDGEVLLANPAMVRMLGYGTYEELAGSDLIADGFNADFSHRQFMDLIQKDGEIRNLESQWKTRDGRVIFVRENAKVFRDQDGEIKYYEGTAEDISERKQAEERIRRQNLELTALNRTGRAFSQLMQPAEIVDLLYTNVGKVLENRNLYIALYDETSGTISFPVYTIDGELRDLASRPMRNGLTEYVLRAKAPVLISSDQPAFLEEHGIDQLGRPSKCYLGVPLQVGERVLGAMAIQDYERENVYDEGQVELLATLASQAAIALENARLYGAVQQELGERKRAEKELRDSEERYRLLFELSPDAIVVYQDGRVLFTNQSAARLIGAATPQELIGRPMLDFVHPDYRPAVIQRSRQQAVDGKPVAALDEKFIRLDGSEVDVEVTAAPFQNQGVLANLVICRDITERKRAEDALRQSENQLRTIFEASVAGIILVDPQGRITLANRHMAEMFDCSLDELVGSAYVEHIYPEEKSIGDAKMQQLIAGEIDSVALERRYIHKDGKDFWGFLSGRRLTDESGKLLSLVGVITDITERIEAGQALERQAEELRQRNQELDRLYRASGSLLSSTPFDVPALARTIVDVVQQEFGQANCSVFLVNRESDELDRLAVAGPYADQVSRTILNVDGAGLVPQAIRSGKVINTPDVRNVPSYIPSWSASRAELTIPLRIGDQTIGAIDVQSAQPNAFNANDEHLMSVFAERAALSLEHARLFAQTERRLNNLAALRTIDLAISSSFDLKITLGILLDQVIKQLKVHAADILVFNPVTQTFQYSSGQGFRTQAFQNISLRLSDGYAGRTARERRSIRVQNLDQTMIGMQAKGDFSREGFISYFGVPLIAKGQVKGVMEIYQRDILDLEPEATTFLEMLASQAAIAIDNTELFYNLQSSNAELVLAYDGTLAGWASAQELRDKEIEGHTRRAADLTTRLARAVGMSEGELMHIHRGALLHDIGKMGIPESVVLKPGPLTEDEWAIMRKHPEHAFKMLAPISYLQPALEIPYSHHERWDGSGYPRGLKGDQIPLAARVFAVVDVWDALTSDRPYRPAWTEEETRAYLRQQAGILFEPRIVEIFLGEIINAERR
jgi:PAS domain S-box-containing protein